MATLFTPKSRHTLAHRRQHGRRGLILYTRRALARAVWPTLALGLLLGALCAAPLWAQSGGGETLGFGEAPLTDGNLDAATNRAVRVGQEHAILGAVRSVVDPGWVDRYQQQIEERIVSRMNTLMLSYRTELVQPTPDGKVVQASVAIRVNRQRLEDQLRSLGLPVMGDPRRPVSLVTSLADPLAADEYLQTLVLDAVQTHLRRLNLEPVEQVTFSPEQAAPLADPEAPAEARAVMLAALRAPVTVYVGFSAGPKGFVGGQAAAFRSDTGETLAGFELSLKTPVPLPLALEEEALPQFLHKAVEAEVLQPVLALMHPAAMQPLYKVQGEVAELALRVTGLETMEALDGFEQAFFQRGAAFASLSLDRFTAHSVTYRGTYRGQRRGMELALTGQRFGLYRVAFASWDEDVLELEVRREADPPPQLLPFPPQQRPLDVATNLQEFFERNPSLVEQEPGWTENEDNGWLNRANPLPLEVTAYGQVDTRTDSDVYRLEGLTPGSSIELGWYRVGRTNLAPALRIYTADGSPVRSYIPRTRMNATVKVPEDQTELYVEVADRFGFIAGESGGYLRFAYLLNAHLKE